MATRNYVPRADAEGNIGTVIKKWFKGWFTQLYVSGNLTDGTNSITINSIVNRDHSTLQNKNTETDIKHVTDDQKDALDNANSPSAGNPIATLADTSSVINYNNTSDGESSTSGLVYIEKLKLTFTPPATGDYEIHFSCLIACSNTGTGMKGRIQIDDTTTKKELLVQADGLYSNDYWKVYTGHFVVNLSTASHDIDLDFASNSSGKTMYIKEAVITARKI